MLNEKQGKPACMTVSVNLRYIFSMYRGDPDNSAHDIYQVFPNFCLGPFALFSSTGNRSDSGKSTPPGNVLSIKHFLQNNSKVILSFNDDEI